MATETIILDENNLDDLPVRKSVYAIFASIDNKPVNCRYVGETDNLKERTNYHFSKSEQNECLKEFMQSNKMKILIYELLPNSDKEERLKKEKEWIRKYNPQCNK
jgi:excinuclease UvrABC nuclease subunit